MTSEKSLLLIQPIPLRNYENNGFLKESVKNYSFDNNSKTNEDIELRFSRFFLQILSTFRL